MYTQYFSFTARLKTINVSEKPETLWTSQTLKLFDVLYYCVQIKILSNTWNFCIHPKYWDTLDFLPYSI